MKATWHQNLDLGKLRTAYAAQGVPCKVFRQDKIHDNGKTAYLTNDPSRALKVRRIHRMAIPRRVALSQRNELSKLRESYWREIQSLRQQLYQKQQAEADTVHAERERVLRLIVDTVGKCLVVQCSYFRRFFVFRWPWIIY